MSLFMIRLNNYSVFNSRLRSSHLLFKTKLLLIKTLQNKITMSKNVTVIQCQILTLTLTLIQCQILTLTLTLILAQCLRIWTSLFFLFCICILLNKLVDIFFSILVMNSYTGYASVIHAFLWYFIT